MNGPTSLGWNETLAAAFAPCAAEGCLPGRVVRAHRGLFRVQGDGAEWVAVVSGRLRDRGGDESRPAVGDWVALRVVAGSPRGAIAAVLPRRTAFVRRSAGDATVAQVLAANVDTVFVVSGLDHDHNPRRLERYLVLAWQSGARPVLVLNKADLVDDPAAVVAATSAVAPGVPIHAVSALEGTGLGGLDEELRPGTTVVLLGSSGAGKSTLLNRLSGKDHAPTAPVRAHDSRGRHTTTDRQLFALPSGALLIDTPGLRELQLWDAPDGIAAAFDDIETLAAGCRFADCRHEQEPGCAVKAAVAEGRLDPARLESHFKLRRELSHLAARHDAALRSEENRKNRALHRAARRHQPRE